jgi:hypothetical protein
MLAQEAEEGAAAGPAVVVLDGKALEEREDTDEVVVPEQVRARLLVEFLSELFDGLREVFLHRGGEWVLGAGFVNQSGLAGPLRADHGVERFTDVGVVCLGGSGCCQQELSGVDEKMLVVAKEPLGNLNVGVGEVVRVDFGDAFVEAGFEKELAVERAVECNLACGAAAGRADLAGDGGAVTLRFFRVAETAEFHVWGKFHGSKVGHPTR